MKRETILLLLFIAGLVGSCAVQPCDGSCSQSEEVRRG